MNAKHDTPVINTIAQQQRLPSRRSFVAALFSVPLSGIAGYANNHNEVYRQFDGIELKDARLFPTPDALRFIVEIRNLTDLPVDAPSLGVILRDFWGYEHMGWATPISPVLHAHSSGALLGIAPECVANDGAWQHATWLICDPPALGLSYALPSDDIKISYTRIEHDSEHLEFATKVRNTGTSTTGGFELHGLLWDIHGRVCGSTYAIRFPSLSPGEESKGSFHIAPNDQLEYISNPFALIDSVVGLSVSMSLQPTDGAINSGCPAVLPWNR